MAKSGRRTRSEWRYKIDSLIHAQMMNEAEGREQKERINMLILSQMETTAQIKRLGDYQRELTAAQIDLTNSQKLTDRTLRAFIDSLRKGHNGDSSH